MSAREELFRRVAGSFVDEDRANGLIDAHAAEEYRKGYAAALREVREAIEAEYLTDETGHPEDIGYQRGIDDALGAVDRMAGGA